MCRTQGQNYSLTILVLAITPGRLLHKAPQDLLAYIAPQLQMSIRVSSAQRVQKHPGLYTLQLLLSYQVALCVESPGSPQLAPTLGSVILPRYPPHRVQGLPGQHSASTPATLPKTTLQKAPWNTLACSHFSFSYPDRCSLC